MASDQFINLVDRVTSASPADTVLLNTVINGTPAIVQISVADLWSSGVANQLPDAAAPPATTTPVGKWLRNNSDSGPFGWVNTSQGWQQLNGAIGPVVNLLPSTYTVAILAPTSGTISGIVTVTVQAGSGFVFAAVRDGAGTLLVQGSINGTQTFSFDSRVEPDGPLQIAVTCYDNNGGAIGQYGSAAHTGGANVTVTVANNTVAAPSPSPAPAPAPSPTPTSTFTPTDITTLVAWYDLGDTATTTLNAGNIATLTDKSGHAHNGAQATTGNQVPLQSAALNGLSAARFPATGTKSISIPAATQINEIFATGGMVAFVYKPKGGTGAGGVTTFGRLLDKGSWGVESNSVGSLTLHQTENSGTDKYWGVSADTDVGLDIATFAEIEYSRSSTGNQPIIRANGNQKTLSVVNQTDGTATLDTDGSTALSIGCSAGTDNYYGDLEAVFLFKGIPTATEKANLRAYVATRWGLTIANTTVVTPSPGPSPTPSPSPTPAGQKIGVFTAGDSTIETSTVAFETYLGRSVDFALQFGGAANISDLTGSTGYVLGLGSSSRHLLFTQPLVAGGMSLSAAAAGSYNSQYQMIVNTLAGAASRIPYVRLEQEFNGDWFAGNIHGVAAAGGQGGTPAQYAAAFRIMALMIRAAMPSARIVWCPNIQQMDPTGAWPGDDVVDVIGTDLYENSTWNTGTASARWATFVNASPNWDLTQLVAFAKAHGKPICFPEYGSNYNDGAFFDYIASFCKDSGNNVEFHAPWDSNSAFPGLFDDHPVNKAHFLSDWA